ncbi:MAG: hypothetical protein MI673_04580 [Thiotrichales bacterium]|nr:hypothetical protein [Thiotrichales bacterium]
MRTLLTLALCAFLFGLDAAQAKPKFPPPPDSQITLLGDSMVYNGIPMEIRVFGSRRNAQQVTDYYKRIWPKGNERVPGYSVTDMLAPWTIVTYMKDGYLMTVQVTPAKKSKGSTGYLAMSKLPPLDRGAPELGSGFPKLRGSFVANDIQSKDLIKKGRTILLSNGASVGTNVNFYRDYYLNQGWQTEMDQAIAGGKVHTLRFRNGNKNVSIVINGGKHTSVTAQITKEGMF